MKYIYLFCDILTQIILESFKIMERMDFLNIIVFKRLETDINFR